MPTPGVRDRVAAALWAVVGRPRAQLLLGAIASLGGGYESCANFLGLKQALRRSSPADSALSAALFVLWLLIAIAGVLILAASLFAGKEKGGQ